MAEHMNAVQIYACLPQSFTGSLCQFTSLHSCEQNITKSLDEETVHAFPLPPKENKDKTDLIRKLNSVSSSKCVYLFTELIERR